MAVRKRGRAAVADRKRRLAMHPVCAECAKRGIVRPSTVPDHIVPLQFGGSDDDENIQGLCALCHAIKSAGEGGEHSGAQSHPGWLRPSGIPVEIVCGPPFSGRLAYALARAGQADTVIAMDLIMERLVPAFRPWAGALDPVLYGRAMRVRNALLGSLERAASGCAWFVSSAASPAERGWWSVALGGVVVLLNPGKDECVKRALERGPAAVAGVYHWFEQARLTWTPGRQRLPRVGVGADGYPIGR